MPAIDDHIAAVAREGDLIVAAARRLDLDSPVPTCPDWTLRELIHHTGRTHLWAAANVENPRPEALTAEEEKAAWGTMPDDPQTADWYGEANARLVRALTSAPADAACWSFLPAPSPLAFWARRQAHETAIHRVDAQSAAGTQESIDRVSTEFAVDGIDELLTGFYGRGGGRLRSETPRTLAVTAGASTWLVHIGPDGTRGERAAGPDGPSDCAVRGPAHEVYLALWNRGSLTDLTVTGDADLLALWSTKAQVRWS